MGYKLITSAFILSLAFVASLPAQPAKRGEEPLVEQVRRSIERGIKFLRDQQSADGSWDNVDVGSANYAGGWTSMALLALLNSGVKPDDPAIQKGLEYLRRKVPKAADDKARTYVVGLMTMVFVEAGQNEDKLRVQQCVDWLVGSRCIVNGQLEGWGYTWQNPPADNSNTQYALLGLHAGQTAGAKIGRPVWESIRAFYVRTQLPDRGWHYRGGSTNSSLTMTTAGLCGLLIAGMELNVGREILQPDGTAKNCGQYQENKPVAEALGWISRHFELVPRGGRVFYNFYGIERAGRLSGLRFLGSHDWYREGCERLVRMQRDNGSWASSEWFDNWPIVSTSFSLLFLSKGRTPILISKLAHGQVGTRDGAQADWNNDHYDARNLVDFSSRELFKRLPLAWQIFDAGRVEARTEDQIRDRLLVPLLESPIAYFNGHRAPHFTDVEKKLLKQYVEQGGFLLAEACCGRPEFDAGFRKLIDELFGSPDNLKPLKKLSPEHPIWRAHFAVAPSDKLELWGIEQGCKTVVVYSPKDLSCRWEANKFDTGEGQEAFRLGANIVAYATGKEPPKPRLFQTEVIQAKAEGDKVPRGFLKVAQLRHDGDWHPAPQAMQNLMLHLRKKGKLDVALQKKEITLNNPDLIQYRFLYMHGRNQFSYGQADLENLRNNLETGGLLFADACCGKPAFDKAFREFVKKLYPDRMLERIPPDDELFSAEMDVEGKKISTVRCRMEEPGGGPVEFRDRPPQLEGIRHPKEKRWLVIYSKYDIGCALEKHQSTDCLGHDYPSAVRLGSAAVLYALKR